VSHHHAIEAILIAFLVGLALGRLSLPNHWDVARAYACGKQDGIALIRGLLRQDNKFT
jgi:hypothetical protein